MATESQSHVAQQTSAASGTHRDIPGFEAHWQATHTLADFLAGRLLEKIFPALIESEGGGVRRLLQG